MTMRVKTQMCVTVTTERASHENLTQMKIRMLDLAEDRAAEDNLKCEGPQAWIEVGDRIVGVFLAADPDEINND